MVIKKCLMTSCKTVKSKMKNGGSLVSRLNITYPRKDIEALTSDKTRQMSCLGK